MCMSERVVVLSYGIYGKIARKVFIWVCVIFVGKPKHVLWFHVVLLRDGRYFERVKHDFLFLHRTQLLSILWSNILWVLNTIVMDYDGRVFFPYNLVSFFDNKISKYSTLILLYFLNVTCVFVNTLFLRIPSLHIIWIIKHFFPNHWYAVLVLLYFMNS